jgi:HSP20 family protein
MADFFRASLDSFTAMQTEFRQLFDEAWRRAIGVGLRSPMTTAQPFAARMPAFLGQPAADVREGQDSYAITVELPGLTREDIDLSVRDNLLTISGHKTDETERNDGPYHISERRFGRFERSFAIPQDVDRNRIEAGFREGVLKIQLPRSPDAPRQSRKIEVKGAA